jgi:hypothetical protein
MAKREEQNYGRALFVNIMGDMRVMPEDLTQLNPARTRWTCSHQCAAASHESLSAGQQLPTV